MAYDHYKFILTLRTRHLCIACCDLAQQKKDGTYYWRCFKCRLADNKRRRKKYQLLKRAISSNRLEQQSHKLMVSSSNLEWPTNS